MLSLLYSVCLHQDTEQDSPLVIFQRITAAEISPGLMYFGCSIHGNLDLNEDRLVDLAVGSLGNAVLLWFVMEDLWLVGLLFRAGLCLQKLTAGRFGADKKQALFHTVHC